MNTIVNGTLKCVFYLCAKVTLNFYLFFSLAFIVLSCDFRK